MMNGNLNRSEITVEEGLFWIDKLMAYVNYPGPKSIRRDTYKRRPLNNVLFCFSVRKMKIITGGIH